MKIAHRSGPWLPIAVCLAVLMALPMAALFVASLLAAAAVVAAIAGLAWLARGNRPPVSRRRHAEPPDAIELAPEDYRRLSERSPRD